MGDLLQRIGIGLIVIGLAGLVATAALAWGALALTVVAQVLP